MSEDDVRVELENTIRATIKLYQNLSGWYKFGEKVVCLGPVKYTVVDHLFDREGSLNYRVLDPEGNEAIFHHSSVRLADKIEVKPKTETEPSPF